MLLKDERVVKDWPPVTRWVHLVAGLITRHMLKAFTPALIRRWSCKLITCDFNNNAHLDFTFVRGTGLLQDRFGAGESFLGNIWGHLRR